MTKTIEEITNEVSTLAPEDIGTAILGLSSDD